MTDIPLLNGLIFTVAGIVVFATVLAVLAKAAPFELWKEIVAEQNVAIAVLAGAIVLGVAWIIAAAMH